MVSFLCVCSSADSPGRTVGAGTSTDIVTSPLRPCPGRGVEIRLATVEVILSQCFVSVAFKQILHLWDTRFIPTPDQVKACLLHGNLGVLLYFRKERHG